MKKLLDKVRPLTVPERRKLAEEDIYLTTLNRANEERAMMKVLDMVFSKEEVNSIPSFKEEDELFAEIIRKTYNIEEIDEKNS